MDQEWQAAFGRMIYGIYVLTVRSGDRINGMIASWVTQVSHEPPMIMAAVHPDRYSCRLIEQSNAFALHVVARSQKDLLKRFKGPDPDGKFQGIGTRTARTGSPVLTDCLAWFDLSVKARHQPGNHVLYICEVVDAGTAPLTADRATPLCTLDIDGMYTGKT